jgi:hypothetical protein
MAESLVEKAFAVRATASWYYPLEDANGGDCSGIRKAEIANIRPFLSWFSGAGALRNGKQEDSGNGGHEISFRHHRA